jgi:GrpB-like predicted nucleotidyltransferase (UPF0157 family)
MSERIVIVPYDPRWPADYASIATALCPHAPEGAVLHHIGSTAVPGLAAKDVIDLQLTVTALGDVDAQALAGLGFVEREGLSDHPPPGRVLAPDDLAKRFFRGTRRRANLHVRVAGRFNQRYPLLCRDYLRSHPVTAAAYETIKRQLAGWFPEDMDAYYDVKDPLFDVIMDGAAAWADLTGWREPSPD